MNNPIISVENYERLSDMNDLGNSFKFNNNHAFDGFNNQKNMNEDEENKSASEESNEEITENTSTPQVINIKERKVMTDWLNAQYTSAFQYKKVNYSPYVPSSIKNDDKKEVDIDDPIVVYEFLKKYTNILYDYNCESDVEKIVVDILEKELKDYFHNNSTNGLEEFMDQKFFELKERYLVIKPEELPAEKISKMLFIKELYE